MAKENKAEKKEAKKAAKAEKKAAKGEKNPEIVKSVISSVTAVACVAAMVVTSLSITNKICNTNKDIAAKAGTSNGTAATSTDTGLGGNTAADDFGAADDTAADLGGDTATDDFGAADDTAAPADTGSSDTGSSSGSGSSSTGSKTNDKEDGAPVGTDVAKIVAYYNTVANNTKAYKGKMVITGKQGANTKITETSFPGFVKAIANGMIPNDYDDPKESARNYTVVNGKAGDKGIEKILPIDGDAKMSKLPASGVQSAQCAKSGNGYKLQIKLKPESTDSFDKQPPNHKACMDCLNMTSKDLEPFTCQNCNIGYNGGTITATVNDKGLITEFKVYNPMHITGTLAYSDTAIKGTAVIDASWRQELKIAY